MPELQFYAHRKQAVLDHIDRSIVQEKFRFAPSRALLDIPWLVLIYAIRNNILYHESPYIDHTLPLYKQIFTDLGGFGIMTGYRRIAIRISPIESVCYPTLLPCRSYLGYTLEHGTLVRWVFSSYTNIASWSTVDATYHTSVGFSVTGSSFKVLYRFLDLSAYKTVSTVATATDTTSPYGYFGPGHLRGYEQSYMWAWWFVPSFTKAPEAIVVLETEYSKEPELYRDIRKIEEIDSSLLPDELVRDYRMYKSLVEKGFTKEEIEFIWYSRGVEKKIIEEIDLAQVNWGAIDKQQNLEHGLIALFGSNQFNRDAVLQQIEWAKKKNYLVYKPRDYSYLDFYRKEKEKREWLITENELAYQLFGREDLELKAVADFYWREVVERNRIPMESQIVATIEMWLERAKRLSVDYAIEKLRAILRK